MREICIFTLLTILSPLVTGIIICLYKFFSEKCSKLQRYFLLRKKEKGMQMIIKQYSSWYDDEQIAIIKACILNNRYERANLFSLNDLKIWKAFI